MPEINLMFLNPKLSPPPKSSLRHIAWTLWLDHGWAKTLSFRPCWLILALRTNPQRIELRKNRFRSNSTAYAKLSPDVESISLCMEEHTTMNDSNATGPGNGYQLTSVEGGFDWPWHPSSRLGSVTTNSAHLALAYRPKLPRRMCVTSRQRKLDKKQSNNAVKIKRFRLCVQRVYGIVCLKGCLPSPR
jgi:hypothetical protein